MGIEYYEFEAYDPKVLEHLRRHLRDIRICGSVFYKKIFPTPESVIDFALQFIKDYNGERIERIIDLPYIVGFDGIRSLNDLPRNVEIRKELRDGELVNVVQGVSKKRTNRMVIVAGPTEEGKHGFITIYPGKYCPPFSDKEFWERHAFII